MIVLSNGYSFEYMAASGALAFDGRGWPWERVFKTINLLDPSLFASIIKTMTLNPEQGNFRWYNPLESISLVRDGVANANGLSNPGMEWWAQKVGPTINRNRGAVMGSLTGTLKELPLIAKIFNDFDLVGLEFNPSCPNAKGGLMNNSDQIVEGCKVIKEVTRFPLILKLSVAHDADYIIPQISGLVEAISINSVPWEMILSDIESPLARFGGGGVSGKVVQPLTWGMVERLKMITEIPVIGPSVWDFEDIKKLRELKADAISFGSVFLRYPWRPTLFVRKDKKTKT